MIFSIFDVERITKNTNIILRTSAIKILIVEYSARSVSRVVNEPGPAINGNANGTMDELPSGPLFRKSSISSIISIPKIKITKAPATANDSMSTLNNLRIPSPVNKKATRMKNAIRLARKGLTFFDFNLILRIMGIDPIISIMAKSTMKALVVCIRLKFI